jgi:hypothetical protein
MDKFFFAMWSEEQGDGVQMAEKPPYFKETLNSTTIRTSFTFFLAVVA